VCFLFIDETYGRASGCGDYLLATLLVELVLAKVAMWSGFRARFCSKRIRMSRVFRVLRNPNSQQRRAKFVTANPSGGGPSNSEGRRGDPKTFV
jgi:hypothetical protein